MKIKTLDNFSAAEIAELFNAAFADYFVKVNLSSEYMQNKIYSENIRLEKSVGIFSKGKPVGFILHAIRGKLAYNAGTGVLPEFRGQHATLKMYKRALKLLKKEDVTEVRLEVIKENTQAIKSYERVGFVKKRNLPGFSGKTSILQTNNEISIKEINTSDFQLPRSFCDWEPTWQHKIETTNKLDTFKIYGAYSGQNLVGFLCANLELGRVAQFSVHPGFRRQKVASSLFQHLSGIYTDELRVFNIDGAAKESQLFLENIGLQNTITQHEMVLKVN